MSWALLAATIVLAWTVTPNGKKSLAKLPVTIPNSKYRPAWCSVTDWNYILIVTNYNLIASRLIAAIGQHETHWGKLGVGRDFICGYGVYDRSATGNAIHQKDSRFKGFENQVNGVWYEIKKYFGTQPPELTLEKLDAFNRIEWKASDKNWHVGVWESYKKAQGVT